MNDVAYRVTPRDTQRNPFDYIDWIVIAFVGVVAGVLVVGGYYAVAGKDTQQASPSCQLAINKVRGDMSVLAGLNREVPRDLAQRWTELLDKECGEWGQ